MIQPSPIITNRLFLRPVELGDASEIAALMSPRISRHLTSWPPAMTVAAAIDRIGESRQEMLAGGRISWGVFLKHDLHLIGWVELTLENTPSAPAEISCWIGEIFQKQNYATEALGSIMTRGPDMCSTTDLFANVLPDNTAGLALLKKLGFAKIERRKHDWSSRKHMHEALRFQIKLNSVHASDRGTQKSHFSFSM